MAAVDREERRGWTFGIFAYLILLGVLLQFRGALLPSFQSTFELSEGQLGLVATAASAGFLPSIFVGGAVASRVDARRFTLLATGLMAVAVAWIATAPTYPLLLVGFSCAGVASGLINAVTRPIISHLHADRRGRMFNLLDMVWAIGATAGPLVATGILLVSDWRLAYVLVGLAFLPLFGIMWRLDLPTSVENERDLTPTDLKPLLATAPITVLVVAQLLLSFVESGIFIWLPYYVSRFFPRSVANLALAGFLATYIPGRYAFSRAADRVDNTDLVLGSALVAVPLAYVAFGVADGLSLLVAVFALGFLVAGMFPTLLAWAVNRTPEYSGPITALALGMSGIGFLVFPAVMGIVADRYWIGTAMQLLVVVLALIVVVMGVAKLMSVDTRS